jgi:3-hydroxyisobutyrate dehydrogenase-like beta-hydroxyacid dehydrogenase
MARIGFIGLGNMGGPMAGNLVKKGHTVKGFDLIAANLTATVARGVTAAKSAKDAATDVDVVVTMLPNPARCLSIHRPSTSHPPAPRMSWPPKPRCCHSTRPSPVVSAAPKRQR